jgi:DNA-binding NarL/FixJ family response regulator
MSCRLLADALQRTEAYEALSGTTREEVISVLERVPADILLWGTGRSEHELGGLGALRQIRELYPRTQIIVMVDILDRSLVVEAFRSGASGVFWRSESFEILCKCIQCVHHGQVWVGSTELQFVLDALAGTSQITTDTLAKTQILSKREEDIARLAAEGLSNRQISQKLNLSEHTIKNYLFRIFEKLGVSTRVELAVYALRPTSGPSKSSHPGR